MRLLECISIQWGVKRRTFNFLAGLGITSNYQTILNHINSVAHIAEGSSGFCSKFNIYQSNLYHILRIVQGQLKTLAQASRHNIVVSWG